MKKFSSDFFSMNRQNLAQKLENTFIVVAAHNLIQSSGDTTFPFRQDSNFWYLTGIDLPDMVIAIDTNKLETTVYLPERNEYQKQWDGEVDKESITKCGGIDNFKEFSMLTEDIKNAEKHGLQIGCLPPPSEFIEPYGFYANPSRRKIAELIRASIKNEPTDIRMEIAKLRSIKQPLEIAKIQSAIDGTGKTLKIVKENLHNYRNEVDIAKALTSGFYRNGLDGHAFEPIVAGGKNAATIHYRDNNSDLSDKDLLLLDVGAQSGYYAADISRTWSLSSATSRQAEIHEVVLDIQQLAFSLLKPGILLREYQKQVEQYARSVMKLANCSTADDPYPHGISHFLGLDVHDAGDYDAPLQENMIITVEPGIYLKDENIGVRIEDDVLITQTGIINLSEKISNSL